MKSAIVSDVLASSLWTSGFQEKENACRSKMYTIEGLLGAAWAKSSKRLHGGKWDKIIYAMFVHLLGHSYGKDVQTIGLKAPGNYSASIWYNDFSLC